MWLVIKLNEDWNTESMRWLQLVIFLKLLSTVKCYWTMASDILAQEIFRVILQSVESW
jgi:hypothetical protein